MSFVRLGVLAAAGLVILTGCGGGDDEPQSDRETSAQPQTFTASGTVTLLGSADSNADGCQGSDFLGDSDLAEGANITVTDNVGTKLALGELGPGKIVNPPVGFTPGAGQTKVCQFSFSIDDIPSGSPVYSIEVTDRGPVDFTEDEADALALSIET